MVHYSGITPSDAMMISSESAIRDEHQILRRILRTAPTAVFCRTDNNTIVYCNHAFSALHGHEPDELIGSCANISAGLGPHRKALAAGEQQAERNPVDA